MRKVLFSLFYTFGLIRLLIFLNRRKKITIVLLHQVTDGEIDGPYNPLRRFLSSDVLKRHVELLAKYYHFVPYSEAVEMIAGTRPVKPNSLCLTFDDGYRNNITQAYPVLKQFSAPFTIFLAAGLIERRLPMWVDRLDYAFGEYSGDPVNCILNGVVMNLSGTSWSEKFQSFQTFRRTAKLIDCDDHEFLNAMSRTAELLEDRTGKPLRDIWEEDDISVLLTWDDITAEDRPLVSYASHTQDHMRLGHVSLENAREQLEEAKRTIEERTRRPCLHFAYPDGDYNDSVCDLVKQCGYISAVTVREGLNSVGSDLFRLARIPMPIQISEVELLARVSGLSLFFSTMKARIFRSYGERRNSDD